MTETTMQSMKVINVTTGARFCFPDYATAMRIWQRLGKRLWRGRLDPLGDGWIVSWPA